MTEKKPYALIVDDDPKFNKILRAILTDLGVESEAVTSAKEFLQKLKTTKPDLCLVDLNIGELGVGYTLIQAIRSVLGPQLPLVVISRLSDQQSIAHALEIGANDFIVKPIDPEVLATKLSQYVSSRELSEIRLPYFMVPDGGVPATVEIQMDIAEVDSTGVILSGGYVFAKGTVFYLQNDLTKEIAGRKQPLLMTITRTWVEADGKTCGAYAEFDSTDTDLLVSVRRWLHTQAEPDEGMTAARAG